MDDVSESRRRLEVGELAVLGVFLLLVASWVAMWRYPRAEIPRDIFLAGFVGGFTNTVAIRMLFERYRYLPGSGVLLKEREAIIATLADTMEEHILNPGLVEDRLREITGAIDRARIAATVNSVIDELRGDLVAFVNAPEQKGRIDAAIREEGGFWGDLADSVGLVTYRDVADRLCAGITGQIDAFRVDEPMIDAALAKIGSLDELLLRPGHPLVQAHYGTEQSVAQLVFERMDMRQLVVDRLSAYDAAQIRDIISSNIREHLAWLEVFGVLLGLAFATVAALVDGLL